MHLLLALRQKLQIKHFMVLYLGFLLVFSSFMLKDPTRLLKGLLVVALYVGFDLIWTRVRDKIFYLPVSSFISGFILALVALPNPPIFLLILLPLLAVVSKQFIHLKKARHIFNPAAFAMGVMAFFQCCNTVVSWWGVAWGKVPFWIVLMVGLFILWKQSRFHVAIPFAVSYLFFLALLLLFNNIEASKLLAFLKPQILDPTIIFFATVMLVEPLTSTFPTKNQRILYGALVGFCAVLVSFLASFLPLGDPLIYGLLLGNLVASLFFLPWRR